MKKFITFLFLLFVFNGFSQTGSDIFIEYSGVATDTILPGASVNVNCTLTNTGDKLTDMFAVEFFISEDTVYSSGDIFLGVQNNIILNVSENKTINKTLFIPDEIYSEKWNILFVIEIEIVLLIFNNNIILIFIIFMIFK